LFTTRDLSPLTASSGWLSFFKALSQEHIELIHPSEDSLDKRIEVVDTKTGCHLGHFFKEDGFCINASTLNFFPSSNKTGCWDTRSNPISWQSLRLGMTNRGQLSISEQILLDVLESRVDMCTVFLGAGCFWHVEFALRRLPGIINTTTGYAGGWFLSPTYQDVCKKDTKHAEVVKVEFDPNICNPRVLVDCFLAMHDPTMTRAHGKRSTGSGQYRSCIFPLDLEMKQKALNALSDCKAQLGKDLSTEVRLVSLESFWIAEDRHQLHYERLKQKVGKDVETLSVFDWLLQYGRRSDSVMGSSESVAVDV
jgi:peptide-methionine (S)-S-oxide reductase